RLGKFKPEKPAEEAEKLAPAFAPPPPEQDASLSADEWHGLIFAGIALVGVLVFFGLLTLPPGAPLRAADGALIGNTPFMNGLIAVIMVLFLVTGAAYG